MFRLPETTTNTQLAAACVTIGIPVTTHRKIHEGLGEERKTFTLGDKSLLSGREIFTQTLLKSHNCGDLEKLDPCNVFLDALRGVKNRGFLVKWLTEGKTAHLTLHPDKRCLRTLYESGPPTSPPVVGAPELFRTPHIAVAAALSTLGVPVVKIEDGAGRLRIFVLPRYGFALHSVKQLDAKATVEDFQSGKMAAQTPDHPFLYAHAAVRHYKALLHYMKTEQAVIYFEDSKGSGRAAVIRSDAKTVAFDRAQKFFDRRLIS